MIKNFTEEILSEKDHAHDIEIIARYYLEPDYSGKKDYVCDMARIYLACGKKKREINYDDASEKIKDQIDKIMN